MDSLFDRNRLNVNLLHNGLAVLIKAEIGQDSEDNPVLCIFLGQTLGRRNGQSGYSQWGRYIGCGSH